MHRPTFRHAVVASLLITATAYGVDIEGVLPASLDQPRIYVAIARDARSAPLTAKGGSTADLIAELTGEKPKKRGADDTGIFAIDCFLDTGASGFMLSKTTADALGITPIQTSDNKPITFYDVGVAGPEPFHVTELFHVRTHEYGGMTEADDLSRYAPPLGPIRLKVRQEGGIMDELTGGLDVAGMPVMAGKVMVIDARPLTEFDKLKTRLVLPNDKSIPTVDTQIALTYVDYARFTRMDPENAPRVTMGANPMIGPDPFNPADKTPAVTATHNGKTTTLNMLLDTGAASSMISVAKAKALGITIENGKLIGVDPKDQFVLPIGGIGGAKNVPGFYLDAVQLPVAKGEPIRYLRAPVLVLDISVKDEKTGQSFTLDGVFGMNYLVASANISVGLLGGGIENINDGRFDFIVIDNVTKTLGMKLKK